MINKRLKCKYHDLFLTDIVITEYLQLRTFALIVCAQRNCAGNATVICHALLRALVKLRKTFAETVDDKSCTALDKRRS